MNERIKDMLTLLFIILISAAVFILLFKPEMFGNPYSIQSIDSHKLSIEQVENELLRNEKIIESQILERERLREMNSLARVQADEIKQKMDTSKMKYHIPSLLISLEQSAREIGISQGQFFLDYHLITSTEERQKAAEEAKRLEEERKKEEESKKKNPKKKEDMVEERVIEDEPEVEENALIKFQYEKTIGEGTSENLLAYDNPAVIKGLVTTTIPLRLKGATYAQVREYISFLDNLDFVEPSIIDLHSEGEKVNAVILIHVFHESEGGAEDEDKQN